MATLRVGALLCVVLTMAPQVTRAQSTDVNAEARVFFDRGNALFEQAGRVRGRRQRRLLEEALQNYVSALRIVRSRNALFNAAVVLEQLERPSEAFGYYREYLAIPGLSEGERNQAQQRLDGIRPRIAIVAIETTPSGAEVFVDRLDLAARGETPVEIAVPAGEHTIFFRHPHYTDAQTSVTAVVGETRRITQELEALPVALTLRGEGQLSIDGNAVDAGVHELPPGNYVVRLETPGRDPVQRLVELAAGQPQEITLVPGEAQGSILRVVSNVPARVRVDSQPIGAGQEVDATVEPGGHLVRVEADGYEPWEGMINTTAGGTAVVRVTMSEDGGRPLGVLPHVALGVTAASAVGWVALMVVANNEHDEYKAACRGERSNSSCDTIGQNQVEEANLRADILLGVTGAVAITTVIFYILNRSGDESTTADVQLGRNGGALTVGRRF